MTVVTVGLKLACSLILSVGEEKITVNGFSKNHVQIEGGHGITRDVPKEFWDKWLQENKESKLVQNGFIFANENHKKAVDEAKEKKGTKSGTEKLKQNDGVEAKN